MEKKRAQWGSKIGFILAAAGSAVEAFASENNIPFVAD